MEQHTVRLTKEIMAVVNGSRLIVVPSGTLVRVLPAPKDDNLVRLLYNGQEAVVFSRDLKQRAAPLDPELAKP